MIRFVSPIPSVPLPDPLWYELLQEIAPGLPDRTLDLVQVTRTCERNGTTILDYVLTEHGVDLRVQYPKQRQSVCGGMMLMLSERDMARLHELGELPCEVVCYERSHPRDLVSQYPDRLWVTRFWFGGPVWLSYLGVEHIVVDAYFLMNKAWFGALTRGIAWAAPGDFREVHDRLFYQLPYVLKAVWQDFYGGGAVHVDR